MWFFAGIIGFLLGLSSGEQRVRKLLARKLGEFSEAKGLRLLDREGNEIPLSDLVAAAQAR